MYQKYFELSRSPFGVTPDTNDYFPTRGHEDSLSLLKSSIHSGDGIAVLLGDAGAGKTLMCRLILQTLDATCSAVFLTNSHMPCVRSMLQAVLYDLSIAFEDLSEQDLRLRLTNFLMERFSQGGKTLLVVDEAQNLSTAQLEELRLITNLEGKSQKAVQVLLCGQMGLVETSCQPQAQAFRQRIAAVAQVPPLDAEQTVEYIRARIAAAGGSADSIFTASALCEVIELSGGNPLRINRLCHGAMRRACQNESGTVDAHDIEAAYRQLCLPGHEVRTSSYSTTYSQARPSSQTKARGSLDRDATTVVEVGAGCPSESDGYTPARRNSETQTIVDPESEYESKHPRKAVDPLSAISRLQKLYSH